MNREFLESLGLEKEVMDKVMVEHGKSTQSSKDELAQLTTERDGLKEQLTQRDTDLKDLQSKSKDSEELQTSLADLQSKYDSDTADLNTKLSATQLNSAIELGLTQNGAKNIKAAKALLDNDTLKIGDKGQLLGLSEQLTALKESDAYLFGSTEQTSQANPNWTAGGNPNPNGAGNTKTIEEMSYQELAELKISNPGQFNSLTKN